MTTFKLYSVVVCQQGFGVEVPILHRHLPVLNNKSLDNTL